MGLLVLFITFIIALAMGMPITWSLGISSALSVIAIGLPLSTIPQKIFTGMDVYVLMCIPLFILTGKLMGKGGLTKRLLDFSILIVGFARGGLALANVAVSMLFGGITGSALADASALGSVEIPMMTKNGYSKEFSAAITSASACMGPIIPPSAIAVIYTMAVSGVSIGALFAAGIMPGLLIGIALMISSYIISKKRNYPKVAIVLDKKYLKIFLFSLKDAFFALMTPLIIIGGILGGIFTPTEAAAVAAVYSFFISFFIYREVKLSDLPEMFIESGVTSALVLIIIGTSNAFGMIISMEQLSLKLKVLVEPMGYLSFLLAVNIIFLWVGTFLDLSPAILILAPIFAPIANSLGIHPIHFGTIVILNLTIGLITPPLGEVLFVVAPIASVSLEDLSLEILPFIFVLIFVLILVTYIPVISLFIPQILNYV